MFQAVRWAVSKANELINIWGEYRYFSGESGIDYIACLVSMFANPCLVWYHSNILSVDKVLRYEHSNKCCFACSTWKQFLKMFFTVFIQSKVWKIGGREIEKQNRTVQNILLFSLISVYLFPWGHCTFAVQLPAQVFAREPQIGETRQITGLSWLNE